MDGGANSSWIDNGSKGMDFAGNLELVDFATFHLCKLSFSTLAPSQWPSVSRCQCDLTIHCCGCTCWAL